MQLCISAASNTITLLKKYPTINFKCLSTLLLSTGGPQGLVPSPFLRLYTKVQLYSSSCIYYHKVWRWEKAVAEEKSVYSEKLYTTKKWKQQPIMDKEITKMWQPAKSRMCHIVWTPDYVLVLNKHHKLTEQFSFFLCNIGQLDPSAYRLTFVVPCCPNFCCPSVLFYPRTMDWCNWIYQKPLISPNGHKSSD